MNTENKLMEIRIKDMCDALRALGVVVESKVVGLELATDSNDVLLINRALKHLLAQKVLIEKCCKASQDMF